MAAITHDLEVHLPRPLAALVITFIRPRENAIETLWRNPSSRELRLACRCGSPIAIVRAIADLWEPFYAYLQDTREGNPARKPPILITTDNLLDDPSEPYVCEEERCYHANLLKTRLDAMADGRA